MSCRKYRRLTVSKMDPAQRLYFEAERSLANFAKRTLPASFFTKKNTIGRVKEAKRRLSNFKDKDVSKVSSKIYGI